MKTKLPNSCPYIGKDIKTCQSVYGKKILLSLGGGVPTDYYLESEDYARTFADFLWNSFGPNTVDGYPRPFGDAVVDGFDFDIESLISADATPAPPANYQSQYYSTMINHLKYEKFSQDSSKSYYISGAPQCVFPDVHLDDAFKNSWFDFIFVQLYNTPQCNSRAEYTGASTEFSNYFSGEFIGSMLESGLANPAVKIFAGLVSTHIFHLSREITRLTFVIACRYRRRSV